MLHAVHCRLLIYEFSCPSVIVKSNIYSAAIAIISSLQTIIFITRTCVFAKLSTSDKIKMTSAPRPGVRTQLWVGDFMNLEREREEITN